MRKLREIDFLL